MKTADFLSLLKGVKSVGKNQWLALCPAHHDTKQSLSVKEADGKILVKCFAGCELTDILKPLGLEPRDLFLDSHEAKLEYREIEAVYHYTDANGKPFEVVRTRPKGFYQRRPDGKGGYINDLKGIMPTLYHQDKLGQAITNNEPVYFVEGEKDCDNLWAIGLVSTTNPMGAGKWRSNYSEALHGANLIIIPDNDGPGRDHANHVAKSCYGITNGIRILELPGECKDVSDWLDKGHTVDELRRLTDMCLDYEPTLDTIEPKKDGEVKEASFAIIDHRLYEQVYADDQSAFVEYDVNTGEVKTVTHIMQGETKIIPRQGEELKLGAVKLPSGAIEYGDTLSLLREIETHIFRYLDVSNAFRKFAGYYILLSWLYDKFSTLPYVRAIGDTGCGKSRLLDVLGLLCYKPTLVSGCITPAPIYRMLRRWNGTMILDEADLQNSDEYSEVVKILNCGFERGRPVIRATKDNPDKLQFLPTFGPKVFATRRRFKDAALEARCLTEIMQETTRDDIPATLTSTFYKEQEALRNKLLLFRLRNYNRVNAEESIALELHGVEPRLKQISAGFASLFAGQPEVLADYQNFIQHHQRELIEQRAVTPIGQVVEKLFALMESVTNVTNVTNVTGEALIPISSKDIAEALNMTPQAVGQIIKTLGLQTKLAKIEGSPKRYIVYDAGKLDTLKKRYIPPEENDSVTMVTKVTMVTGVNEGNQAFDRYEVILGMSVEKALEIWRSRGEPVIHLGPGENCLDLAKLLSKQGVSEHHLEAVRAWIEKRNGKPRGER